MDEIYVVIGSTGEYSDHTYWFVHGYLDKKEAEEHASKANAWLVQKGLHSDHGRRYDGGPWDKHYSPYDPDLRVDYTGARYGVEALPFKA